MSYLKIIKNLYKENIYKLHEEGRFLMLLSFSLTFIMARLIVYGIVHDFLPPPFGFFFFHGVHIHHLIYGIVLLLIAGFMRIPEPTRKFLQSASILYGMGAALTLDEFAILISLNSDAYFGSAGRISIDVVVVFFLLLLSSLWHGKFWRNIYDKSISPFLKKK